LAPVLLKPIIVGSAHQPTNPLSPSNSSSAARVATRMPLSHRMHTRHASRTARAPTLVPASVLPMPISAPPGCCAYKRCLAMRARAAAYLRLLPLSGAMSSRCREPPPPSIHQVDDRERDERERDGASRRQGRMAAFGQKRGVTW
jgi:hypothetical protein